MPAVGIFQAIGQSSLVRLNHLLLLAKVVLLLRQRLMPLIESSFALTYLLARPRQLFFRLRLLGQLALLDHQVGFFELGRRLLLGPVHDAFAVAFDIHLPKSIQQSLNKKTRDHRDHGDHKNDDLRAPHDARLYRSGDRARKQSAAALSRISRSSLSISPKKLYETSGAGTEARPPTSRGGALPSSRAACTFFHAGLSGTALPLSQLTHQSHQPG